MSHPASRVLTVLELLQAHGRLSGSELARRLQVDVRTTRRYIRVLEDIGIPITAERGRYGAYSLVPGFKLRGNYASSFVAPELSSIGDLSRGGQTSFTSYSGSSSQFLVDTRLFPSAIGIPGCSAVQAAANPICTIPTSTRGISFSWQ